MSRNGWCATLPALAGPGTGGGSGAVPFSGNGAPSVSTLSSSVSYLAGPVPSLYVDMTAKALYVCTTAGTNATSAWAQISGGAEGTHPFQVYKTTNWLRVLVRGGYFITDVVDPDVVVGTDGDLYPYDTHSGVLTGAPLAAVVLSLDPAVNYIWAKLYPGGGEDGYNLWRIFYSSAPTSVVHTSDPDYTPVAADLWGTFPKFDGTIWPIAVVDATDTTHKVLKIRQLQTTDVVLPSKCW
jgi:hypothetical protein